MKPSKSHFPAALWLLIALATTTRAQLGLPDIPQPTAPITSYPTTLTETWSATTAETTPQGAWAFFYVLEVTYNITATLIEPWPSTPTFPYAMTQTAISAITTTTRIKSQITDDYTTAVASRTVPVPSRWSVWEPQPTHMAVGASMPCGECNPAGWTPDERCVALGLDTACQGQCKMRDGKFWCYGRYSLDPNTLAGGRVCWGNGTQFRELMEPCLVTDHQVACTPCQGKDRSWNSVYWQ